LTREFLHFILIPNTKLRVFVEINALLQWLPYLKGVCLIDILKDINTIKIGEWILWLKTLFLKNGTSQQQNMKTRQGAV